jgi:hypothetical protein
MWFSLTDRELSALSTAYSIRGPQQPPRVPAGDLAEVFESVGAVVAADRDAAQRLGVAGSSRGAGFDSARRA